jgi:hypothetical protein
MIKAPIMMAALTVFLCLSPDGTKGPMNSRLHGHVQGTHPVLGSRTPAPMHFHREDDRELGTTRHLRLGNAGSTSFHLDTRVLDRSLRYASQNKGPTSFRSDVLGREISES